MNPLYNLYIVISISFIFLMTDTIAEDDEDVPELVDNFDAPSKTESKFGDIDGESAIRHILA